MFLIELYSKQHSDFTVYYFIFNFDFKINSKQTKNIDWKIPYYFDLWPRKKLKFKIF